MELNRYPQTDFISDISQIEFEWSDVAIVSDKHDISISFDTDEFKKDYYNTDKLKELILTVSQNVSRLDNFTQEYSQNLGGSRLDAIIGSIYLKSPELITFDYWCTDVNSTFDVNFSYENGKFSLVKYGMKELSPIVVD